MGLERNRTGGRQLKLGGEGCIDLMGRIILTLTEKTDG